MIAATPRQLPLVLATLLAGLVLSVLPVGTYFAWWRPEWPALLLLYWMLRYPEHIGVGWAWLLGLVIDGIEGSPLGQHALALAVFAYLAHLLMRRLTLLSSWQQPAIVVLLVAVYITLNLWVQGIAGIGSLDLRVLTVSITSALVWPLLRQALDLVTGP
jgi:rod shape-determining protein MreD